VLADDPKPATMQVQPAPANAPEPEEFTVPIPTLTISTDRPSFSDSTGIQPVWTVNLETGLTYTYRDRDDVRTDKINGPEFLARLGVIEDRLELRLITSGYVWSQTDTGGDTETSDGLSDVLLGFKVKVNDQCKWIPRIAIGAQTSIGIGSDDVSTQVAEPTLKFIWSYDLGLAFGESWKGLTLGGNANIAWPTTDGDHFAQGQGSIYLSFPIVDGVTGFAEYFVYGPTNKDDNDAAHSLDFGVTYLLNRRIQLDARVGFGLNNAADNAFAGVGISFLF